MKKYFPKDIGVPYLLKILLLFGVYFLTARIGLGLYSINKFATFIWPPTGLALAALIIYGYDIWPGVLAGAFVVNLITGANPLVALGIAIGNSLEAIIGTYLLR